MPRVAVVVNPLKLRSVPDAVARASAVSRRLGWDDPTWIETRADDPGRSMAAAAAGEGFDLVLAAGGDGTVRGVVAGVLDGGTGTTFGILPLGTGNLLARNLGIPLDLDEAFATALQAPMRQIDVGQVQFDDRQPEPFLVIVGAGLDASTMGGTSDNLKKLIGWGAYVEAGARASLRPGFRVTTGFHPETGNQSRHVRSFLVCNCGVLTAGLVLVPQAKLDDGLLDTVTLAPYGTLGFATLGLVIATGEPISERLMSHTASASSAATFSRLVTGQIDGDAVGTVQSIRTWVLPGALAVRAPRATGVL